MKQSNRMEEEYKIKMAMIAGATQAIKFKNRNPRASDQEIIQHVSEKSDEILNNIENVE